MNVICDVGIKNNFELNIIKKLNENYIIPIIRHLVNKQLIMIPYLANFLILFNNNNVK